MVEAPRLVTGPETGGCGPSGRSVLVLGEGPLVRPVLARAGEAARRVAVVRGDVPGVQLGADPADRHVSERGKRPGGARRALWVSGRRTVRCCRRGVAEDPYRLELCGLVARPLRLPLAELRAGDRLVATLDCTGWLVLAAALERCASRTLARAGRPAARCEPRARHLAHRLPLDLRAARRPQAAALNRRRGRGALTRARRAGPAGRARPAGSSG